MKFMKIVFIALIVILGLGFAYVALTDVSVSQKTVTVKIPAERALGEQKL